MPTPYLAPRFFAPSYFGGLARGQVPNIFEEDLLAYLERVSGLKAYPGHVPQLNKLPALTLFLISGSNLHKLSGAAGLATSTYQIGVHSGSYLDVGRIAFLVRTALDGYRGPMGGSTVRETLAQGRASLYSPAVSGSDRGTHSLSLDFRFSYAESIPF